MNSKDDGSTRHWLSKAFSWVEDIVYIGLGALLAGCALTFCRVQQLHS